MDAQVDHCPRENIDLFDSDFTDAERSILSAAVDEVGPDPADVLYALHGAIVILAGKAGFDLEDTVKAQSRYVALAHGPRH